jgi:L-rhamnose isomerase
VQKALLYALLQPHAELKKLQDSFNMTRLMVWQEELKTLPFGAVWEEYLSRQNIKGGDWLETIEKYEAEVLRGRK